VGMGSKGCIDSQGSSQKRRALAEREHGQGLPTPMDREMFI
jgi:hypothetical protein